ncbi:putative quinol monooxygenase [Rhodocyclus purpureus]|uniref:putative quinol monooxygenase n=1 Tax=Rhodocyclus purpureus TaxID=1067 RepID=UPI0019145B2E|nr:putative quinol monooxygenase [Rhodocyclus purpureus]MBK5915617.1 antibiotic biosynthesis monooxygenase [Rhodocyclus purpureus]
MTVHIVARFTARPDTVAQLRPILQGLLEPTRKEAGCLRYELLHNAADPTDFTFVEEWADDAAIDAHLQTPHLLDAVARSQALSTLDVRRYAAC